MPETLNGGIKFCPGIIGPSTYLMSQSPVTWRSSKITFVVTATWASISTLKYKIFVNIGGTELGTYVWAEAISLFSVQRAELIAEDETESVFAGAAAPRVAVEDLVEPDGRYIFFKSEKSRVRFEFDLIWSLEKMINSIVENLVMVSFVRTDSWRNWIIWLANNGIKTHKYSTSFE